MQQLSLLSVGLSLAHFSAATALLVTTNDHKSAFSSSSLQDRNTLFCNRGSDDNNDGDDNVGTPPRCPDAIDVCNAVAVGETYTCVWPGDVGFPTADDDDNDWIVFDIGLQFTCFQNLTDAAVTGDFTFVEAYTQNEACNETLDASQDDYGELASGDIHLASGSTVSVSILSELDASTQDSFDCVVLYEGTACTSCVGSYSGAFFAINGDIDCTNIADVFGETGTFTGRLDDGLPSVDNPYYPILIVYQNAINCE